MERPSLNGVLPNLALYDTGQTVGFAQMMDAYAQRAVYGGYVNFDGSPWGDESWKIIMVNDPPAAHQTGYPSDKLSQPVGFSNSYSIDFFWYDFY